MSRPRHPCFDCVRTFSQKNQRDDHWNAAHNNTPYKCPITDCGVTFVFRSDLKNHEKEQHQDSPKVVCPGCQKSFDRDRDLTRHLKGKRAGKCAIASQMDPDTDGSHTIQTMILSSEQCLHDQTSQDRLSNAVAEFPSCDIQPKSRKRASKTTHHHQNHIRHKGLTIPKRNTQPRPSTNDPMASTMINTISPGYLRQYALQICFGTIRNMANIGLTNSLSVTTYLLHDMLSPTFNTTIETTHFLTQNRKSEIIIPSTILLSGILSLIVNWDVLKFHTMLNHLITTHPSGQSILYNLRPSLVDMQSYKNEALASNLLTKTLLLSPSFGLCPGPQSHYQSMFAAGGWARLLAIILAMVQMLRKETQFQPDLQAGEGVLFAELALNLENVALRLEEWISENLRTEADLLVGYCSVCERAEIASYAGSAYLPNIAVTG